MKFFIKREYTPHINYEEKMYSKEKLEKYPELIGPISEMLREENLEEHIKVAKTKFAKDLKKISPSLKRASSNHKRAIKESLRKNTACEELQNDVEKAKKLVTPLNLNQRKSNN